MCVCDDVCDDVCVCVCVMVVCVFVSWCVCVGAHGFRLAICLAAPPLQGNSSVLVIIVRVVVGLIGCQLR